MNCLLLRRPPGREAFPDVLSCRLLERSAKVRAVVNPITTPTIYRERKQEISQPISQPTWFQSLMDKSSLGIEYINAVFVSHWCGFICFTCRFANQSHEEGCWYTSLSTLLPYRELEAFISLVLTLGCGNTKARLNRTSYSWDFEATYCSQTITCWETSNHSLCL